MATFVVYAMEMNAGFNLNMHSNLVIEADDKAEAMELLRSHLEELFRGISEVRLSSIGEWYVRQDNVTQYFWARSATVLK